MYPNISLTNKVSMIIFNLKVINSYGIFTKIITINLFNRMNNTLAVNQFRANPQVTSVYKTLALDIIRVVKG